MRFFWLSLCCVALCSFVGCGDKKESLKTEPLTEEQLRQIREQDSKVDEEEKGGSHALPPKKGK